MSEGPFSRDAGHIKWYFSDSDYDYLYGNQVIEDCSETLRNLAGCLRGDLSVVVKIRVCNRIMADVFTCLSRKPEDDVTAPAQEEVFVKRGLGRCINQCLRGQDRMNFIQCKSMCHK